MKKFKIIIVLVCFVFVCGCSHTKKYDGVLNVLNWTSYIPDEVIHDFEDKYNIKVNYSTYSSNEELLAKITSSKEGTYDVIFPSDYMVELMIERNLIEKIDISKIDNYNNLDPIFLNQSYDYGNKYTLPFLTTIVVIAVNKDKVLDNITEYNDLLNEKYKNNIVLLDDQRIVIGLALLANKFDMNDVSFNGLGEAKVWLLSLKKNIKAYDSDSPKSFFMTEEADIGVMWNAEAELAKIDNPNIEIIYPGEGHAISTDNYAIAKGAKNKDNAYKFIDYILSTSVQDKITKEYPYISPNKNVKNSSVTTENVFKNGFYVKNIGDSIRDYDKLWAEIK